VSKNLGRSWLKVGSGLPNAPITELRWHAPTSTLFAANFGRGAWSVKLSGIGARSEVAPSPVAAPTAAELAADARRAVRMQALLPSYTI
jgi:hypothetical protein